MVDLPPPDGPTSATIWPGWTLNETPCKRKQINKHNFIWNWYANESTPLNKLAVADAAWARMPVDSLNMTLA